MRLVARPAPSRRCPCGWSVTSSLVAESRRPVLPGLLSPLRGHADHVARQSPPSPGKAGWLAHHRYPEQARSRLARCRCRRSKPV